MAYVDIPKIDKFNDSTKNEILSFLGDIRSRKEFNQYNYGEQVDVKTYADKFLHLHGPQLFVKNFVNFNTPYKRLFINWQTGTGKTIAALSIAKEFATVHKYKKIFIIGFTKSLFVNELLSHPEFGFISDDELEKLKQLRINTENMSTKSSEYKKLVDYLTQLKRRLTDRGYFKFYGYKELSNNLFLPTMKGKINGFVMKDIFKTSIIKRDKFLEVLNQEIKNGNIEINDNLLNSMKNSLLIADEIHNLYNIETENNYGIALQYILDILGKDAPYSVLMSATPMSGSATEIIDLFNILIRKEYLPNNEHLKKEDYFERKGENLVLKPGALEKLGMISAGRTSFLLDLGKGSYPKRQFVGESVPEINYLKFTKCEMSDYQYNTIQFQQNTDITEEKSLGGHDAFLFDFAFPDPDDDSTDAEGKICTNCGITNVQDYKNKLRNASQKWKDTMGIQVIDTSTSKHQNDIIVSGPILEASTLQKYSAKYYNLLQEVLDIIKNDKGKILIYHHKVHSTGVLFIQEIFRMNGFIDEASNPINTTICSICGVQKQNHSGIEDHSYMPARFITIHSNVDKNTIMNSIDKFNSLSNLNGYVYRILIGSKIIREGYNFKAVRNQLVCSIPNDISSIIQVFGRVVRRGSHLELPSQNRYVDIKIFVSSKEGDNIIENTRSELHKYYKKMQDYLVIQEIERIIRIYSVDSFLSYDSLKSAFPEIKDTPTLDALPYQPIDTPIKKDSEVTYFAYNYIKKEIDSIIDIIWVIMSLEPVWTYQSLFDAIKGKYDNFIGKFPRFGYNPETFTQETYNLALHNLNGKLNSLGSNTYYTIVNINKDSTQFYVMCPVVGETNKPLLVPEIYLRMSYIKKKVNTKISVSITSTKGDIYSDTLEKDLNEMKYPELALIYQPSKSHYNLIEKIIIESFNNPKSTKYNNYINLYKRFHILITVKDVLSHMKFLKNVLETEYIDTLKTKGASTIIGYHCKDTDKIYTGASTNSEKINFMEVIPLVSIKRIETEPIVGFPAVEHNELVFKIRPPIKKTDDLRKINRGAVCRTRLKQDLIDILKTLQKFLNKSESWKKKNYPVIKERSNELCNKLELALLSLEEDSRNNNKNERWVYLFNDTE
jgi:hypothetical protein